MQPQNFPETFWRGGVKIDVLQGTNGIEAADQ
jgi:hypothetical protein